MVSTFTPTISITPSSRDIHEAVRILTARVVGMVKTASAPITAD